MAGVLNVDFSGQVTAITETPFRSPGFWNRVNQFQDHLSWFAGRHSIKAGFVLTYAESRDLSTSANMFGNVSFDKTFSGFAYVDFLLGFPTTASRAFPALEENSAHKAYDLFVTDEFKVTPKLTVNAGVRYELHPGWYSKDGLAAVFDPSIGKIVVADGSLNKVSPLFPAGYVGIVEAHTVGRPGQTLIDTPKHNFAPRIGIAYRPAGDNTVLRAGFGIFYDIVPTSATTVGSPFTISERSFTNTNVGGTPVLAFPSVFPPSNAPTQPDIPDAVRQDLRIPYSMQYNATIEHQQWNTGFRISYIGTNTRQGEYHTNLNQPVVDARPYLSKVSTKAFPQYPAITFLTNGAGHHYHSLNFEIKRHMARGLLFDFGYVYARDIGNLERDQSPENAFDLARERAVWPDIPTHRFTGDFVYDLPFGKGQPFFSGAGRLTDLLVGGWEVTSAFGKSSGQFLTPLVKLLSDPTGTAFVSTPSNKTIGVNDPGSTTRASVTIRPDIIGNPNLPSDQRSIGQWFDKGAFKAPAIGNFGTSAKGVIKGPGFTNLDSGLAKQFHINERLLLRWEMTATNILNHVNFSNPGLTLSSSSAGMITNASNFSGIDSTASRSFRMGLRLDF